MTDFMPVAGARPTDRHRLLRTVRGVMRFVVEAKPRFDYGRAAHKLEISAATAAQGDPVAVPPGDHASSRPGPAAARR